MKIAVASSGAGHVARGIETWAIDTAVGLKAAGADVTLFTGGAGLGVRDLDCKVEVIPCWQRGDVRTRYLAKLAPSFCWRWGLKRVYDIEQRTFWRGLRKRLVDGQYDVLHVQDPLVAQYCAQDRKKGLVRTQEILAHGTEEPPSFLAQFDCLQHLAPWHFEQTILALGSEAPKHWVALPNFVDTDTFSPREDASAFRAREGISDSAFVFGCVAAVKRAHKRIDFLLESFREVLTQAPERDVYLCIAGSRTNDTDDLLQLAESISPDRVRILTDLPRAMMPEFLRACDVFVLPSLFEMMPIAVLEAMSSGLPVIANGHPVLNWMTGEGGVPIEMGDSVALSSCMFDTCRHQPGTQSLKIRKGHGFVAINSLRDSQTVIPPDLAEYL